MVNWVPILRQEDVFELIDEAVDRSHNSVTIWYFKGTAWAEVVLHVDDNKSICILCNPDIFHEGF